MNLGLIIITLAVYSVALLGVSHIASRRASASTFFTGDRNQNVVVVTLGMISAAMSGVTFISVPGMVLGQGYGYMQMALGFVVGQIVIATVLVPLYYKLGVVSIYEYLSQRFGARARHCGACLFFIGKMLGTAVRLMLVCAVIHTIVAQHDIPFEVFVAATGTIACLYTLRGGVKSVVWGDLLKSIILLGSTIAIAIILLHRCDTTLLVDNIRHTPIFDTNPDSPTFLLKSVVAGVVVVVAMTGLDQDMMQRTLSCRNRRQAQYNVIISSILQTVVIALLLLLGTVMLSFIQNQGGVPPTQGDALFPTVAFMPEVPMAVGALFVLGLAASSFSSIGSALTALTTSLTLDLLHRPQGSMRRLIHCAVAVAIGGLAILLYRVGSSSAIDLIFGLAAYTYGPILGLFAFGILSKRQVRDKATPILTLITPVATFAIDRLSPFLLNGYRFGHEILLVSAIIMFVGLWSFSQKK